MSDDGPDALLTTDPARAADALRAGRLAVLPTETVYGLGALASRPDAVARVFAVKGRPADHPLIVHLADAAQVDGWAIDIPDYARRLAAQLWPGSLTLVLPRGPRAGLHVTGGQETVGLRVPD
ncbi:MAG: L-threonylcarbamoyladenylate synthase, partial [Jiangellales bacterium]